MLTKQQKLDAINIAMARTNTGDDGTGYFLPVLIGDILYYVDKNCFWKVIEYGHSRDLQALEACILCLFFSFVPAHNLPIDMQDYSCIDYVYSLIT